MNIEGLLGTQTWHVESMQREVTLHELSYGAALDILKSQKADDGLMGAWTVKHALALDEPVEEVAFSFSFKQIEEISKALRELWPVADDEEDHAKNSASTPTVVSASR